MGNMKKAIVVGGSNGIGLSVVNELSNRGYNVIVVDICEPDKNISIKNYEYISTNLYDFDENLFVELSKDLDVEALVITAGLGRIANFEDIHISEIQKIFEINTIAMLKILKIFYNRIINLTPFYCGVMGSIAGIISSPMFAVYAASKAAICRFVESVNIELEINGTNNRILNVSPGSVKGTKFNGGENDISLTSNIAKSILDRMLNSETLYIPEYDSVYKRVIERYSQNPHKFGLESYQYKVESGRAKSEKKATIGYLSGTFDLFHVGHLKLLKRAKSQCDYLIVGVHKDASHKGKTAFIPFEERIEIISSCKYVDKAVVSCTEDSDAWKLYKYDKLFVGSDYKGTSRFEKYEKYFKDKGVEIVYFPYTKGTSSTQIRENILKSK